MSQKLKELPMVHWWGRGLHRHAGVHLYTVSVLTIESHHKMIFYFSVDFQFKSKQNYQCGERILDKIRSPFNKTLVVWRLCFRGSEYILQQILDWRAFNPLGQRMHQIFGYILWSTHDVSPWFRVRKIWTSLIWQIMWAITRFKNTFGFSILVTAN